MLADSSVALSPTSAPALAAVAEKLSAAAEELCQFNDGEPGLSGACGLETAALEARLILSGGACSRLSTAANAVLEGRRAEVRLSDVSALSRLETVLSLGEERIGAKLAEIDAAQQVDVTERIGSFVGLASGVVGLVKSIF